METVLRKWKRQLAARKRAHEICATMYADRDRILSGIGMVMSITMGTLSTTLAGESTTCKGCVDQANVPALTIITASISWTLALATAAQRLLDMATKSEQHRGSSRSYQEVVTSLDVELAKCPSRRGDMDMFMERVLTQMSTISDHAPVIPYGILKRFPVLVEGDQTSGSRSGSSGRDTPSAEHTLSEMVDNGGDLYPQTPPFRGQMSWMPSRSSAVHKKRTVELVGLGAGDVLVPLRPPTLEEVVVDVCALADAKVNGK